MTNKEAYLREAVGNAARVWVLSGAKPTKLYVYVDHYWVEVTLRRNGEEAQPHRRAGEQEQNDAND